MSIQMYEELTLAVLLSIKRRILKNKKRFTTRGYFVGKNGELLPPQASSISKAEQRNIGGAVIQALVELGIENDASSSSHCYGVVMYNLAESIRDDLKSGPAKINAVIKLNDEQGHEAILKLVDTTAKHLYQGFMRVG